MRELAGSDPQHCPGNRLWSGRPLRMDTQSETTSQAPGMHSHDFCGVITKHDTYGSED